MFFGQTLRNSLFFIITKASIFPRQKRKQKQFKKQAKNIATGTKDPGHCGSLIQSTPLVQSRSLKKLWNLGKTSGWFDLAKGGKYIKQLWQIHVTTNPSSKFDNFNKSMLQILHQRTTWLLLCSGINNKTTSPWNTQQQLKVGKHLWFFSNLI